MHWCTALTLLLFLPQDTDPVDALRSKVSPSVIAVAKRTLEYGGKRDLRRAAAAYHALRPFVKALDKRWSLDLDRSCRGALAQHNPKALRFAVFRILYWDLVDILDPLRKDHKLSARGVRTRILKARYDYRALAVVLKSRRNGKKIHVAVTKSFQDLVGLIPTGRAYGQRRDWKKKAGASTKRFLKLLAAALPEFRRKARKR